MADYAESHTLGHQLYCLLGSGRRENLLTQTLFKREGVNGTCARQFSFMYYAIIPILPKSIIASVNSFFFILPSALQYINYSIICSNMIDLHWWEIYNHKPAYKCRKYNPRERDHGYIL